jgi:hypothetical protein
MLVFLIIVSVLIGVAYADYCLIDNTAHFGICFGKVAEAEDAQAEALRAEVEVPEAEASGRLAAAPLHEKDEKASPVRPPRSPAPAWLLQELEPVLELREGWSGVAG